VGLRLGLAELLIAAGQLDAAEVECRAALKASEKSVPAMVALATVYGGKKRHELARMVLENARQVDADDPAVWNRLAFTELALGNRPQALEAFRTAAALRPDYPEAHANYGAMLADADDFGGAAKELELAVKYAPRSAAAWLNLGNAYRGLQQFAKAEGAYQKAQQLDPKLADAHFNLAVLYLDVEKPGLPALQRLEQGVAHFDAYEKAGGVEPRVAAYRKDAAREIDREKKRLARDEKDRLRKEAETRKKAEEAAQAAARPPPAPAAPTPLPGKDAAAPVPAAVPDPTPTKAKAPAKGTAPAKAAKPPAEAIPPAAKAKAAPAKAGTKKPPAPASTPSGAASGGTRGSTSTTGGKLGEEGGDK
jgi:tetratricopeptide (TPR) repeat protein